LTRNVFPLAVRRLRTSPMVSSRSSILTTRRRRHRYNDSPVVQSFSM
jgi:hypothetical protein